MVSFDIVIVTYNRLELLSRCLKSIELQEGGLAPKRIILVNNGDESFLYSHFQDPKLSIIDIQSTTPAEARNIGLSRCSSDFVLFVDDDTLLPDNYFDSALKILNLDEKIDVLGGPDQTYPEGNLFQKALGSSLQSFMTTGHTWMRHSRKGELGEVSEESLILCHLWVRRSLFDIEGFIFPKNFYRNEENILINDLKRNGKKIVYAPNLYIYHYRRAGLLSLLKSSFLSGYFRKKSILIRKSRFHPFFLMPGLFLIYLVVLFFAPFYTTEIPFQAYCVLSIIFSFVLVEGDFLTRSLSLLIQVCVNLSYGSGFLYPISLEKFLSVKSQK